MRKIKTYGKKTYRLLTIAGGLLIASFSWNMKTEERGVLTLLSGDVARADGTLPCDPGQVFTHVPGIENGFCLGDYTGGDFGGGVGATDASSGACGGASGSGGGASA